jgi:hypothetical protein
MNPEDELGFFIYHGRNNAIEGNNHEKLRVCRNNIIWHCDSYAGIERLWRRSTSSPVLVAMVSMIIVKEEI